MIIRISITKKTLESFNYIDDKSSYDTKTALIRDLINKEALRLRVKNEELLDTNINDYRMATCHPEKKHYAKGFCRTCYLKKRYE